MEFIMSLIMLAASVLQIVLFFKIWAMTGDVRKIKSELNNGTGSFQTRFYKHIVVNDIDGAKQILIDEMSQTIEFQNIIKGGSDNYIKSQRENLQRKYQKEIAKVNLEINWESL